MSAASAGRRHSEDGDWLPTRAQQISAHFAVPQRLDAIVDVVHTLAAVRAFADSIDVLHTFCRCVPVLADYDRPLVATMVDSPLAAGTLLAARVPWVATCRQQGETARTQGVNVRDVIHCGIDVRRFSLGEGGSGKVLFLGLATPPRGLHIAIEAARWAGRRLVIAGPANTQTEFWKNVVQRAIDAGLAEYAGTVSEDERDRLYREADCLLAPRLYDPYQSRSALEAMASGCPVVAFARGVYPEIIADGVTGFAVKNAEGMAQALAGIGALDRAACRERVAEHFSLEAMVDRHEALYEQLVAEA